MFSLRWQSLHRGNIILNMDFFFFSSGDCCIIHLALNKSGDNTPQSERKMNFACKLHLPQFQGRIFARQTTPSSVLFRPRLLSFKSWLTLKVSSDNHICYKGVDICGISRRVMVVHFDWSVFRFTPLSKCCLGQKLVKNCLCKIIVRNLIYDYWIYSVQADWGYSASISILSQWRHS